MEFTLNPESQWKAEQHIAPANAWGKLLAFIGIGIKYLVTRPPETNHIDKELLSISALNWPTCLVIPPYPSTYKPMPTG